MRNFVLEAKMRSSVLVKPENSPPSFDDFREHYPDVKSRDIKATLESLIARGTFRSFEDENGVTRYTWATRWGGPKS